MDVLSDALSAVRLGHPSSDRVRMHGRWCVRLEPYEGVAFLAIVGGSCWLLPDGGDPIFASAGDLLLLLPHGKGQVIADSPMEVSTAAWMSVSFDTWRADKSLAHDGYAKGALLDDETDVICGKYRLDFSHLHPLLGQLPEIAHFPSQLVDNYEIKAAVSLLASEQEKKRPGSSIALRSLLDLLLLYLIRSLMRDTAYESDASHTDPVAAAALRIIHSDPGAHWTTTRLAAAVGVSRPTLARRFTQTVGSPPMAYLTWWRLVRAAMQLRNTSDTLAAIAQRVGYGSPYALSHAFARQYGITPGRYRSHATDWAPVST